MIRDLATAAVVALGACLAGYCLEHWISGCELGRRECAARLIVQELELADLHEELEILRDETN